MFKRLAIFALMSAVLASAKSAKTYAINISDAATAGSVQLQPGEYSLKLDGTQVVLIDKRGKQIDTTAKVETANRKFDQTSISISTAGGSHKIISIQLGGSTNRIVFEYGHANPTE